MQSLPPPSPPPWTGCLRSGSASRANCGSGRPTRRSGPRPPPYQPSVPEPSRRLDHPNQDAGTGAGRAARAWTGAWRTAAAIPAGAAPGSSTSMRVSAKATRPTTASTCCWPSPPTPTCWMSIRRSRLTATSAARPASPRCCCKATTTRLTCCLRCPPPGPTAESAACARAAALKCLWNGRTGDWLAVVSPHSLRLAVCGMPAAP